MDDQPVLRTPDDQVQPGHTALLIVNIQNDFVHLGGVYGSWTEAGEATSFSPGMGNPLEPGKPTSSSRGALTDVKVLLSVARRAGVLKVFVRAIYDYEYLSPPMRVQRKRYGMYRVCQLGTFVAEFYCGYPARWQQPGSGGHRAQPQRLRGHRPEPGPAQERHQDHSDDRHGNVGLRGVHQQVRLFQ